MSKLTIDMDNNESVVDDITSVEENHSSGDEVSSIEETLNSIDTDEVSISEEEENPVTILTEAVSDNEIEDSTPLDIVLPYNIDIYDRCMDTVVSLMSGMKFNKANWMLLLNKIMNIVSGVKKLDKTVKTQLIYDILMDYLDNYTDLDDLTIDFINVNAKFTCEFMLENVGSNKGSHKQNGKGGIRQYKLYKADTDAMINTLQITNLLVNKITVMLKNREFKSPDGEFNFALLQQKIPSIIAMIVPIVDKFKHLTRAEKTAVITQAITDVINNQVIPKIKTEGGKTTMELMLINLPMLIETLTGVVNGDIEFDIAELQSKFKKLKAKLAKLFCCK